MGDCTIIGTGDCGGVDGLVSPGRHLAGNSRSGMRKHPRHASILSPAHLDLDFDFRKVLIRS